MMNGMTPLTSSNQPYGLPSQAVLDVLSELNLHSAVINIEASSSIDFHNKIDALLLSKTTELKNKYTELKHDPIYNRASNKKPFISKSKEGDLKYTSNFQTSLYDIFRKNFPEGTQAIYEKVLKEASINETDLEKLNKRLNENHWSYIRNEMREDDFWDDYGCSFNSGFISTPEIIKEKIDDDAFEKVSFFVKAINNCFNRRANLLLTIEKILRAK